MKDMTVVTKQLPRVVTKDDIVVFTKSITNKEVTLVKEFKVRKMKVLNALKWLQKHNKYYKDIEINFCEISRIPLEDAYPFKDKPQDITDEPAPPPPQNPNPATQQ